MIEDKSPRLLSKRFLKGWWSKKPSNWMFYRVKEIIQLIEVKRKDNPQYIEFEMLKVGACNCLTKTPDPRYHSIGCPISILEKLKSKRQNECYQIDPVDNGFGHLYNFDLSYFGGLINGYDH